MAEEKILFEYAKVACKREKIGCYKIHVEGKQGFPDLLLVADNLATLVELKAPTGRLREVQKVRIKELKKFNFHRVHVAASKEDIDNVIAEFTYRRSAKRRGQAIWV